MAFGLTALNGTHLLFVKSFKTLFRAVDIGRNVAHCAAIQVRVANIHCQSHHLAILYQ